MTTRILLPFVLAAVAAPAIAASPFDGTWATDLAKSKLSPKPEVILLKGGQYSCKTCVPTINVAADGKPHPVTGSDYYNMLAVRVVDAHTLALTGSKTGKTIFENGLSVSGDGKTLNMTSHRINAVTGVAASSSSVATRVAPAPAGSHAISGSWKPEAIKSASPSATDQTIKLEGNTFTLSTPTGEGYSATLGGPAVLQKNDPAKTMVKLTKLSDHRVLESDMRGGKVVTTYDMSVSADGRTMTMLVSDKRSGETDTIIMRKK